MLRDRYSARAMVFILLSTIIIILNPAILHAQTANNGNQEPIKIMLTLWPPSFLAYIAQEKGIFEKNGVNVQLLFYKDYFKAAVTMQTLSLAGISYNASRQGESISCNINNIIQPSNSAVSQVDKRLNDVNGPSLGIYW